MEPGESPDLGTLDLTWASASLHHEDKDANRPS